MTRRIEPFLFFNTTQRIEPFIIWLKELSLFLICSNALNFFLWYDSQNWTFSYMTQGNELLFFKYDSKIFFFNQRIECFFNISQRTVFLWLRGLNFFRRKELNPFSSNMTQRIENFFFEYDAKNWTLFLWIWRKELNTFSLNMTQRIEPSSYATQRIEPFLFYASKNWAFFLNMTQRIEFFFFDMTQRIEFFFFEKIKELNLFFSRIWLKESNSFEMTHRIEPLFINLFSIWLKELKSFFQYDAKNWTFLVLQYDSKNWFFFLQFYSKNCVKGWTPFFEYDSKTWTFFGTLSSNNWTFLLSMMNLFIEHDSQNWTFLSLTPRVEPFSLNMTQRIEPLFEYDSFFFLSMTQRKELSEKRLKDLIFLFENVRKNWTSKKKELK